MAEEFVVILPSSLSIEARRRIAAERAFEQEVLALLSELLGCAAPSLHASIEEHRAAGTWDWHIVRSWRAGGATITAVARPIASAGATWGEEIEFELRDAPPPLRVHGIASLDVRVGGSVRVTIGGCPPERLARLRPTFGQQVARLLAALERAMPSP